MLSSIQLPFRSIRLLIVLVCIVATVSLWIQGILNVGTLHKPWRSKTGLQPHDSSSSPQILPRLNMSLSDVLYPLPKKPGSRPLVHHNTRMLHSLFTCIEHGTCRENQTKVAILGSLYFRNYFHGERGGESIWAHSTMLALENMGYTFIIIDYPLLVRMSEIYRLFPELVKVVFMDSEQAFDCAEDHDDCSLDERNPNGIPLWKIFTFVYWGGEDLNPLGGTWTVSPEDYPGMGYANTTYLGYSIEESCRQHRFIPHAEREDRAWILAKYLPYFTPEGDAAWSTPHFDAVTAATGLTFAMASYENVHEPSKSEPQFPTSHVNYGRLDQSPFLEHLARSRVLIGMGNPVISPSPYDALCLGVPFINPIMTWDHDNPSDTTRWGTQHSGLQGLGPPYVYNVFRGDTEGLLQAVKDAIAHPIDSYVPDRMTMPAVEARLADIMETDWRSEAESQGFDLPIDLH